MFLCSYVLMSKNKSANAILTICQSNTFRISYLDTVIHTDEKNTILACLAKSFMSLVSLLTLTSCIQSHHPVRKPLHTT